MSDWKAELDALVSETMHFTRSLRSRLPAAEKPELIRPSPARLEQMKRGISEREDIQRRVADFKAHQQRHTRQREDFAAAQWQRMLASRTEPVAR